MSKSQNIDNTIIDKIKESYKDPKIEENIYTYPRKQSRQSNSIKVKSSITHKRSDVTKWNGWGYVDSSYYMKDSVLMFTGKRYTEAKMPYFADYVKNLLNVELSDFDIDSTEFPKDFIYPKSIISENQLKSLRRLGLAVSTDGADRVCRSHGQSNDELVNLTNRLMDRIPDAVIWPTCHEDVVEIIKICDKEKIVIIPIGGGTSVTHSLKCTVDEKRAILSLDTTSMNEILWIDEESMMACCESGIIGQDLERELNKLGYTVGHEPDSIEFSTLGGWVATKASGMKKNTYGNIEDIVVQVRMATPRGVLERNNLVPRLSCGPEFNHLILGSEGNFGVITEVVLKLRPVPPCSKFGSLMFPDFETGVACMKEIAQRHCQPASIRLMDNGQFQLGRSLREEPGYFQSLYDRYAKFYLTKIRGFDTNKIAVATIKYEGEEELVVAQEKKVNSIAVSHGGIPTGPTNGERGYNMTYAIAYLRDMGFNNSIIGETFETSVPWNKVIHVYNTVVERVSEKFKEYGISNFTLANRVAQIYDTGACLYFYIGINSNGIQDYYPLMYKIIDFAKDSIVKSGGSLSHHHGVGKSRRKWYKETVSALGEDLIVACKNKMDPNNIFAAHNITERMKLL